MLKAVPDFSRSSEFLSEASIDEILTVDAQAFAPKGRERNAWAGSGEFAQVAETYGRNDQCFGNGDGNGAVLETPVGTASALVHLFTNIDHPQLGAGLLSTLQHPFKKSESKTLDDALWLNYFESIEWTNVPQLGSWFSKDVGDGQCRVAHSFLLPNAVYAEGLVANAALWQVARARWAKATLYPDMPDLTMLEILNRRAGIELDQ